jgi:hypothetical protein
MIGLLGCAPGPHFRTETLQLPRYPNNMVERRGYAGADSRWMTLQLSEGKIIEVGVESRVLIQAGVAVVYTDEDGDGLNETFTVAFATSVTTPSEIELQFAAADRLVGDPVGDEYRIAPTKVSIAAGTATVIGHAWLLVRPVLYEGFSPGALDAGDATNFVTVVDVYRHDCDPTGIANATAQALLIWESRPWPFFTFCDPITSSDPAAVAYALGRVGIRNAELGIVSIGKAVYNTTTGSWSGVDWRFERPPDRVEVRYYAGVPRESDGRLNARFRRMVAILATAELSGRICACEAANKELYRWQFDLAHTGASQEQFQAVSPDDLTNPWGTRRGQVYAFRELLNSRILRGFAP